MSSGSKDKRRRHPHVRVPRAHHSKHHHTSMKKAKANNYEELICVENGNVKLLQKRSSTNLGFVSLQKANRFWVHADIIGFIRQVGPKLTVTVDLLFTNFRKLI